MMKTACPVTFCILLALAAASPHVGAQERRGTIAVVRYDPTRVIVAADSRHNLGKGVGTSQNDLACKVAVLGAHVVFVAAGLVGYDNNGPRDRLQTWRAADEARHAGRMFMPLLSRSPLTPTVESR